MEVYARGDFQQRQNLPDDHSDDCSNASSEPPKRRCPHCLPKANHNVPRKIRWPCFRLPFPNFLKESTRRPALESSSDSCFFCDKGSTVQCDDDKTEDMETNTNFILHNTIDDSDVSTLSTFCDTGRQDNPKATHYYYTKANYVSLKELLQNERDATSVTDESTRITYSKSYTTFWLLHCKSCDLNLLADWRFCPNCGIYVEM